MISLLTKRRICLSKKRANSTNPIEPTQEDRTLLKEMAREPKETKIHIKNLDVTFKTKAQEELWNLIDSKDITLISGAAGTGKSHVSILKALELMKQFPSKYKRIVISKPNIESSKSIGFIPGDVNAKLDPYLYSSKYIFNKILGQEKTDRMLARGQIEILAMGFLRGINLDDCIFILEEAQNCDRKEIRTILTRIGENCKYIINGDTSQIDTNIKFEETGLYTAMHKLQGIPQIGIFEFNDADIVRNPLISVILKRLNGDFK